MKLLVMFAPSIGLKSIELNKNIPPTAIASSSASFHSCFKGVYIDTSQTDTNTRARGTPCQDEAGVFVSMRVVSI